LGIARVDREAAGEAVIEPGGEIIKVEGEELNERRTPTSNEEGETVGRRFLIMLTKNFEEEMDFDFSCQQECKISLICESADAVNE
jgi:hypothetical protein